MVPLQIRPTGNQVGTLKSGTVRQSEVMTGVVVVTV